MHSIQRQKPSEPASDYHQAAASAAEQAIDALLTQYWGHTFDSDLLQAILTGVIEPIIEGAITLDVPAWDEARNRPLTKPRVYPVPTKCDRTGATPRSQSQKKRSAAPA